MTREKLVRVPFPFEDAIRRALKVKPETPKARKRRRKTAARKKRAKKTA